MKTYIYKIKDENCSSIFKEHKDEINNAISILIQVFSGDTKEKFEQILAYLSTNFPNACIISSSTDGEIYNEKVLIQTTVVSISLFGKTQLQSAFINLKKSFDMGVYLAKKLVNEKTKLLITFVDGLSSNGEDFLNGIYSVAPDIVVAGGLSADNARFEECYVGVGNALHTTGAVGVALDSDELQVESIYNFGWKTIGKRHKITKSISNRVYTIDNLSAVAFYKKYLGSDISNALPTTGIEFPLILQKENIEVARATIAKYDDGSLLFAGNIEEGEYVHLGIGEAHDILNNPINKSIVCVESFFIYSCMARRRFIPTLIYKEIAPFAQLAPTIGFFTYGEFYTSNKPQLLNQTLTAVAISESTQKQKIVSLNTDIQANKNMSLSALINLINTTTQELDEEKITLEQTKKELEIKNNTLSVIQETAHLGSWEFNLLTNKITWSPESYKIYNIDPSQEPPTYEEFLAMVVPEDRVQFITIQEALKNKRVHSLEIRVKRNDGKMLTIVESGKVVYDGETPIKIVGTSLDITDIRIKDTILSHQSKLAKMGEMINMIAHQWRQPLNAISASAIKLNMQNSLGLLSDTELEKTTSFIEDMTQVMSQTINDFITFTKPNNQKELIYFKNILDDILKIMGTQLQNHNIKLKMDIEDGLSIYTYKKELEHVFLNIISNARDALDATNEENKYIYIRMYSKNRRCIIEIRDNAGGIDENIMDRIFEPYFTTKESNEGSGLGLYMSKKIVHEHLGGRLSVENIYDGANFKIVLKECNTKES